MTLGSLPIFPAVRTLTLAALAVGLVASTPFPALAANSGTWANTGNMNVSRAGHSATLLLNGQVLVAGGENSTAGQTSAELYNPITGKWTLTGSMAIGRYAHSAVLLSSGEVLVAGGIVSTNIQGIVSYTATAELYNPSTGQWTTTGNMSTPRFAHGVALLQSGQVLVAGGANANGLLATAELYEPSTGKWTETGSLNHARSTHATLLQSGQVLMAGGGLIWEYRRTLFQSRLVIDQHNEVQSSQHQRGTSPQLGRVGVRRTSFELCGRVLRPVCKHLDGHSQHWCKSSERPLNPPYYWQGFAGWRGERVRNGCPLCGFTTRQPHPGCSPAA